MPSFSFFLDAVLDPTEEVCDQSCNDRLPHFNDDLLSIDRSNRRVRWYSGRGLHLKRQYQLKYSPLDAKFCVFNSEADASNNAVRSMIPAVAILLSNGVLSLHYFSGESYEVNLPSDVRMMLAMEEGLLFQRVRTNVNIMNNVNDGDELYFPTPEAIMSHPSSKEAIGIEEDLVPMFFSLDHPLAPFRHIYSNIR